MMQASNEAVVLLEMSKEKWPVVLGNKQWNQDTGTFLTSTRNVCLLGFRQNEFRMSHQKKVGISV